MEAQSSGNRRSSVIKQAACIACRKTKTKCLRDPGAPVCKRCIQKGSECIIPFHHVGRQKGTKNKRIGLAKAIYQVEQALERVKSGRDDQQSRDVAARLQRMLSTVQDLSPASAAGEPGGAAASGNQAFASESPGAGPSEEPASTWPDDSPASGTASPSPLSASGDLALNDAENPLQLLAHASDLSRLRHHVGGAIQVDDGNQQGVQAFFGPSKPKLDVSQDMDPIDLGLVTPVEAGELFQYFHDHLTHTRWGLDREIHSLEFIRGRSSFLFTSVLSSAALFTPSAAAISKRLSIHCKKLAHNAMTERYKSVEVVLAFMVNVPWLSFGNHWADDETCSYLASALTIAMDLSLHKIVVPSPSKPSTMGMQQPVGADSIDARKALSLDGFEDVDPYSEWGRRLLRRRERTYIALFVLDRGVCLARGRIPIVPCTSLVEKCDNWHVSDIADVWDSSVTSIAVMRRDLDVLIRNIKQYCEPFIPGVTSPSEDVQRIKNMIENFFEQWHRIWAYAQQPGYRLPPYVQILVSHTRLSTYSSVINHPTAPDEIRRFFRAAGLSSALHVLRAAVHGEKELASMPNNTAIMVAFAACFTLRLHSLGAGFSASAAPSARKLIEEAAGALERIGTTPRHREGVSAILGRYLRAILGRNISTMTADHNISSGRDPPTSSSSVSRAAQHSPSHMPTTDKNGGGGTSSSLLMPNAPLLFSAMSDVEIDGLLLQNDQALQPFDVNLPGVYSNNFDWMDWLEWT
ncbi:hypothetical protein IWX49DRAFT_224471 [Phyllosticta citricarpa]|uniref:Zn(2)-C6 fungal-type domain-containing protein n=1 Tax=Phyllosticta citricarpa TaxID=55181 RepID=A0ABR1MEQ8_9PEZI